MLHLTKLLCKLLSNIESYYFPLWKVNDTIPTLMKSKGKLRMNKKNQTISKEEATAILKSVDSTKRDAIKSFRIPLLLITLISLSFSLVVFSWGMTEHDNLWALGMYIGTASFGIFVAFYIYTFRLLGIKINILPRSKEKIKSELVLLLIFAVIFIFGRQFRVYEGFEYAPHIAALIAGGYMAYLLYKYPTGEYLQGISHND
tara:strand:- start:243 stop:848 length:606 start_codon:yes stop_codon:yes gene_type:complete